MDRRQSVSANPGRQNEIHFQIWHAPFDDLNHVRQNGGIASSMGGLPEVVTHGETGFLFPLGSVAEMAEAGLSLLRDQSMWTRFSQAARADSVERFSNDKVLPLYEELYRDVVDDA